MKKSVRFCLVACFVLFVIPSFGQSRTESLTGKWSGEWMPEGKIDSVTIELKEEHAGVLSGEFVTPVEMKFTKATFDRKTRAIDLEATDAKSSKRYEIDGKVMGTELKGTLTAGDVKGSVLLIKWTFMPH